MTGRLFRKFVGSFVPVATVARPWTSRQIHSLATAATAEGLTKRTLRDLLKIPFSPRFGAKLPGLVALCLIGCGTSQYEQRMQERMQELGKGSSFRVALNSDPTAIYDSGISLQLPKVFDANAKAWAAGVEDDSGQPIDPARLQPPFVELPGFQFSYEVFVLDERRRELPLYCYLALPQGKRSELLASLQTKIQEAFPGAEWQDVELKTPAGTTISGKKMSVQMTQQFQVRDRAPAEFAGRFDLYLLATPKGQVLVGWRGPTEVADGLDFFHAASLSVGTVTADDSD